jgi:hypothetical protein
MRQRDGRDDGAAMARSPTGNLYLRKVVPEKLRPIVGKREIKESLASKIYDASAQALFLRKLDAALRMLRVAEVQMKSADMQKAEAIIDESFRLQVEELGEDQDHFYASTLETLALFERQSWRRDLELELPG